MKTRSPDALVDELARIAGRAEPPPIADGEARWMIDRALDEIAPAPRRTLHRFAWLAVPIAAAAAAALGVALRTSPAPVQPSDDLAVMHLTLPTGDRLTGVAGAQFDVERLAATDRRLRLRSGLVLFDVAHVARGQRFSVATPQLVATAKGTVFSVETDASGSRVRVYEGVVEVEQGGEPHELAAGSVWDSATHQTAIALVRPSSLATTIASALDERAAEPPAVFEPAPVAPAPIVPVPVPVVVEPVVVAAAPPPPDLHVAEAALAAGKLADALALAKRATIAVDANPAWWLVLADAQRGLGNASDAADAYDRAARALDSAARAEAGYSAAYVRFHELDEPVIALSSLIAAHADDDGSPMEERALGLRAQILVALGRKHEAADVATRYLAKFAKSDLHAYMTALTR